VTRPLRCGRKSYALAQEIIKPDDSVAIDGVVTSLVMDMERHQTLPVPDCMARLFPTGGSGGEGGT
jgi:acyl-CoA thioesterase FadM